MPRSGTTLVEQILASHPQAFGAGELKCFETAMQGIRQRFGTATSYPEVVAGMIDAGRRLATAVSPGSRAPTGAGFSLGLAIPPPRNQPTGRCRRARGDA